MKKIVISLISLIGISALAVSASLAAISNSEKSEDNSFLAGEIDLQIDSECSVNDEPCSDFGNWPLTDLTTEKFFKFPSLHPGASGEDTISYHVYDNDSYGCMKIVTTENGCECEDQVTYRASAEVNGAPKSPDGLGNCAVNDGYPPDQVEKVEWVNGDTTRTYTSTDGSIISVVFIKSGTVCYKYIEDTTDGDYTVSGIGTTSVTVTENNSKDVSHMELVLCDSMPSILWFFAWHDDGDNIFEPGKPDNEIQIFGPVQVGEILGETSYELAVPPDLIPAELTGYVGVAWCVGEMNVDMKKGTITCEANGAYSCGDPEFDSACMDISFNVEQSRHNDNFTCNNEE